MGENGLNVPGGWFRPRSAVGAGPSLRLARCFFRSAKVPGGDQAAGGAGNDYCFLVID